MKIGVIGLGNMGFGIASNLVNKGYDVYGYDIRPERGELLMEIGGHNMASCAALGKEVMVVVAMVFSPENLRDILFEKDGLMETMAPGSCVVITATVGPDIIAEIQPALEEKSIEILDTPLMAGVDSAKSGNMHILVSGKSEVVNKYRGLLDDMGSELYFVGERPGKGQAGKMCLQTLFGLTFETAFEIISLSKKMNLNMDEMDRLYRNSGSTSELFHETQDKINRRIFVDTFNPLSILDKDVHLAVDMAKKNHMELPASRATAEVFREAMQYYGDEDIWAAVKVIETEK